MICMLPRRKLSQYRELRSRCSHGVPLQLILPSMVGSNGGLNPMSRCQIFGDFSIKRIMQCLSCRAALETWPGIFWNSQRPGDSHRTFCPPPLPKSQRRGLPSANCSTLRLAPEVSLSIPSRKACTSCGPELGYFAHPGTCSSLLPRKACR